MNPASAVDHLILSELRYAQRLRREAQSLSRSQIAEKFEITKGQLDGILEGHPHEDSDLILACHEEAQRLWQELEFFTQPIIAERYGRTTRQVRRIAERASEVPA